MSARNTKKLVTAALLAALTCVATVVLQFPTPLGGYVHMGDCLVLFSAWLLGPWWGAAAAGIGSMMADIVTSYVLYAPGTLIIKALMAIAAGLLARMLRGKTGSKVWLVRIVGAVVAEILMVGGYFLYEALLLGYGWGAAANMPANGVQAVFGIVVGVLLDRLLTDRLHKALQ